MLYLYTYLKGSDWCDFIFSRFGIGSYVYTGLDFWFFGVSKIWDKFYYDKKKLSSLFVKKKKKCIGTYVPISKQKSI